MGRYTNLASYSYSNLWPLVSLVNLSCGWLYSGRVHADGGCRTTAPPAGDRRTTAGRQLRSTDDVIVVAVGGDVTTSAAARRRQAGRCGTGHVAATANRRKSSRYQYY